MPPIDAYTLLFMAFFVYLVVAGLTFFVAMYTKKDKTLLWVAAGWFVSTLGGAVMLWSYHDGHTYRAALLFGTLVFAGYGMNWNGLRHFVGKPVGIFPPFFGSVVWVILCFFPWFVQSAHPRIVTYSLIVTVYMLLGIRDLFSIWKLEARAIAAIVSIMAGHAAFFLVHVVPYTAVTMSQVERADFVVTVLESVVYSMSMTLSIIVMVRVRMEQKYQHASLHDTLTGLGNRRTLFTMGKSMLERADKQEKSVAALMFDLDWFKRVNDTYGHDVGDEVLVAFANHLRTFSPRNGLCVRLGGEEFVLLVADAGHDWVYQLGEDIRQSMPAKIKHVSHRQTVSVGIAFSVDTEHDLDQLLIRADQALYFAKAQGRDCVQHWDTSMLDIHPKSFRLRAAKPRMVKSNVPDADNSIPSKDAKLFGT